MSDGTRAQTLTVVNLAVSGLLLALLGTAWRWSGSQLALAQAADALADAVVTLALLWSLRVARTPPDAGHPFGHHDAEPLGALVAAAAAAVLSFEVVRSAIETIAGGTEARLDGPVAVVFGVRVLLRTAVWLAARSAHARERRSPALAALSIDARNDVLVGGLALLGFVCARVGWAGLDAWGAIPLGLWVGYSGVELARENIRLLMGGAPEESRQAELLERAGAVEGVLRATRVLAAARGSQYRVWVEVKVDPRIDIRRAHDIEEAVAAALGGEEDVAEVFVHVEPEDEVSTAVA